VIIEQPSWRVTWTTCARTRRRAGEWVLDGLGQGEDERRNGWIGRARESRARRRAARAGPHLIDFLTFEGYPRPLYALITALAASRTSFRAARRHRRGARRVLAGGAASTCGRSSASHGGERRFGVRRLLAGTSLRRDSSRDRPAAAAPAGGAATSKRSTAARTYGFSSPLAPRVARGRPSVRRIAGVSAPAP